MYSSEVLEHFEHPRNVGELPDATTSAQVENPACGDIMYLALLIAEEKIVSAKFRTRGCVAAIACGSVLTEMVQGMTIEKARNIGAEDLLRTLGKLNPEQKHATQLAVDALRNALKKFQV